MEKICVIFIVALLSVPVCGFPPEEILFPVDRELVYSFRGDVSTGVTEPAAALSYFAIQAKLRVQSTTINKVVFKLEDIKYSVYNGAGTGSKMPADEFEFIQIPDEAKAISKPFAATYKDRYITNFEVESSDPVWSRNVKRAIASQFQLKLDTKTEKLVFVTTESGIAGECQVHHLGNFNYKLNQLELRKFSDMSNCSKFTREIDSTSTICQEKDKKSATGSTERHYIIKREDDEAVIDSVISYSGIAFQPFGEFGELQYHVTKQTLKKISLGTVTSPLTLTEPITTSLTFEIPPPVTEGADFDYTFGRTKRNPDDTVNYILKFISTYSAKLHSTSEDDGYQKPDDSQNIDFSYTMRILRMMRQLGRDSIFQSAEKVITSNEGGIEETSQNIFIHLLSKVGTRASIQASYDLLNEGKVTGFHGRFLMSSLPFYLRQPNEIMIKDGEILLNLGDKVSEEMKETAVLTFATLVNRVCKAVTCEPALVDRYVTKFFEKLRESEDYSKQLLYVNALGNIGTKSVVDYLEPLIRGKLEYPYQLRYRAIEVTKLALKSQPEKAYDIYWPILANRTEHLELRISALNMILLSQPTRETFMNVLWFMTAEKNHHLYNFYYSTVQSLVDTTFDCYMHLTPDAAKLAKLLPKPQQETIYTYNRIIDYTNPTYGFASLVNSLSIADEDKGTPNVFSVNMLSNSNNIFSAEYAIHFRIDGFYYRLKEVNFRKIEENDGHELETLLKKLKVVPGTKKPLHLEYIVQKNGQTITSFYVNQNSFYKFKRGIDDMFHIFKEKSYERNFQHLDNAIMKETLHPSDIGIGVKIEQLAPYIMSVRFNITEDNTEISDKKSRYFVMDMRFNLHINYNVRNYNPFGGIIQGVYRSYLYESRIPLSLHASYVDVADTLKIRTDWEAKKQLVTFQMHAKSEAFIGGRNSKSVLNETCPKCSSEFLASKGENYRKNKNLLRKKIMASEIELQVNLFDCEEENILENRRELVRTFFCPIGKNYRTLPKELLSLLLDLQTTYDAIITPLKGSCGLTVNSLSVGTASSAEFAIKIEKDKHGHNYPRFLFSLQSASGDLVKSWDASFVLDSTDGKEKHLEFKAKIIRRAPDEPFYMTCIKMEKIYANKRSQWNILYDKEIRERSYNFTLEFGETSDLSKCPSGDSTQIEISGTSRTQELNPSTWPMAQCEKDRGNHKLYPASSACEAAVVEANVPRNFTIDIKQNKVSPAIKSVMEYVNALQKLYTSKVTEIPKDFSINVENVPNNEYEVQISSTEHGLLDYTPILSDSLKKIMSGFIMPTFAFISKAMKHSSDLTQPMERNPQIIVVGTDSICAVAGSKLLSFKNATTDWPISTQYKLLSTQCNEDSIASYGIFAYNPEGLESMNLKIYVFETVIEIKQSENTTAPLVMINGIELLRNETFVPKIYNLIRITRHDSGIVEIYQPLLELYIVYSYSGVTITLPNALLQDVCGLCGLTQLEPYSGPEGPIEDLNQFVKAYTLNET